MAAWETEDELSATATSTLTTPVERPMRASSRSSHRTASRESRRSRRSRRSVTPPGKVSSSPPPVPGSDKTDKTDKSDRRTSKDFATDENISILDPRRFTPTLHANLVSEILTLRRDQEEKTKIIESLESSLGTTREEEDTIQATLSSTAKENRSLKRQLALLEGGTSSALGELARERDEAVETATETKKRLEALQKRFRTQAEDSDRTQELWAKDKDAWETDKRQFERKLHVAETRLKAVLEEVAAYQAAHANGPPQPAVAESDGEDRAGRESDAGSVRSMSMTNSVRFSVMSKPNNSHSLADELNFDDDSDYQTDPNGRDSVMSTRRHNRDDSRGSVMSRRSHRRHNSSESLIRPGSVARGRLQTQLQLEGRLTNGVIQEDEETQPPAPSRVNYTDTGVQYSPPPSPKSPPTKPANPDAAGNVGTLAARWEKHHQQHQEFESSPEANQRRKRVQIAPKPLIIQPPAVQNLMVSASAQTVEMPLTPPKTPRSPLQEPCPPPSQPKPAAVMVSTSTQTDLPVLQPQLTPPGTNFLPIPSIAIHPPTSRPSTPREPRLPQLFKDFGCQVSIKADIPSSSVGVQTEEIRIDKRLEKLAPHLHPSAITSRPSSPAPESQIPNDPDRQFTPVPGNVPPRNPRRLTSQNSFADLNSSPRASEDIETTDAYPGNNDDGPLSGGKAPMRRPPRISSLFAGFEKESSDEADEFADVDMSDSEYRTALSAPRPVKSPEPGQRSLGGGMPTSPEEVPRKISTRPIRPLGSTETYSSFRLGEGRDGPMPGRLTSVKSSSRNSGSKMRKAAMIQSGIATHSSKSPEGPDVRDPPFPIPTRASSRKPPFSVSLPSDGNRSPTRHEPWHKRGLRGSHRNNSIRKVRSAAAIPQGKGRKRRHGSRSPPPMSPSDGPQTPNNVPPLPQNDITTPKNERGKYRGHQQHLSTNTATTEMSGYHSTTSSQAATGVVDAIAQTMVGEWMFKYVRRRKSFGVGNDGAGRDDSSNDRHKRWVWLAPYERAILWSSRQPSSGSALLGKSGRKLTIQSVLDVKDDNPPPRGSSVFNRSILILTPQRALKFTAVNAERHYLWLTSLSFLAHSQEAVPEIPTQVPRHAPDYELPRLKTKKPGIRDSIRLAKGRNGLSSRPGPLNQNPPTQAGDVVPMPSIPDSQPSLSNSRPSESATSGYSHARELSREAAEPPYIPRFHERANQAIVHGRKRSNTGGHVPPPLSFRGFSGPMGTGVYHAPTNSNSTGTGGSSDIYGQPLSNTGSSGPGSGWGGMSVVSNSQASQRTSETSQRTSNFFEAIGTMRMEAFISPLAFSRFDGDYPDKIEETRYQSRRRSKEIRRRKSRSRQRDSYSSRGGRSTPGIGGRATDDYYSGSRTAGEEDYFRDDPFQGF